MQDNTLQYNIIRIEANKSTIMRESVSEKVEGPRPMACSRDKQQWESLTIKKRGVRWPTEALYVLPLSRNGNRMVNSLLENVVVLFWTGAWNWSINSLTPSALHDVMMWKTSNKNHKTMTSGKTKVLQHNNRHFQSLLCQGSCKNFWVYWGTGVPLYPT